MVPERRRRPRSQATAAGRPAARDRRPLPRPAVQLPRPLPPAGRADHRRRHHALRQGAGAAELVPDERSPTTSTSPPGHGDDRHRRVPLAAPRVLRAVRRDLRRVRPLDRPAGPGGGRLHARASSAPTALLPRARRNAHAWPEVYFAGVGWVPFEPTPGRGEPGRRGLHRRARRDQDGGAPRRPALDRADHADHRRALGPPPAAPDGDRRRARCWPCRTSAAAAPAAAGAPAPSTVSRIGLGLLVAGRSSALIGLVVAGARPRAAAGGGAGASAPSRADQVLVSWQHTVDGLRRTGRARSPPSETPARGRRLARRAAARRRGGVGRQHDAGDSGELGRPRPTRERRTRANLDAAADSAPRCERPPAATLASTARRSSRG